MGSMSKTRYRIGAIGAGAMGMAHVSAIVACPRWELCYVCDLRDERLELAREHAPDVRTVKDFEEILADPSIDAVSVNTLSDVRAGIIGRAISAGKHVLCEKPLAPTAAEARRLLEDIRGTDRLATVDLFNRNAAYLREAKAFVDEGQIGELAIIRLNHCTPGLPVQRRRENDLNRLVDGHLLHDCGMHYVDVGRWFAGSEYKSFEARAVRFWDMEYEIHFMVHGSFENGMVFELNNSFCYTTLAKDKRLCCSQEFIGTQGVITLVNDGGTEIVKMNGRDRTVDTTMPYGGKKLDVYYREFAEAIDTGDLGQLPRLEDAVVASDVARAMVDQALAKPVPTFGVRDDLGSQPRPTG